MEWFSDPNAWVGLLTLTVLEIVLGIDNIVFISILSSKLPAAEQPKARRLGLAGAFVSRLGLLFGISWIVGLSRPLFTVAGLDVSGRSLILIIGGLFLIAKATYEIHGKLEGEDAETEAKRGRASLLAVVAQIMVIDIVFSLDSVITAVGMVDQISIMVIANVIALAIMLAAAGPIANFVDRHPTVKMLALAFLVLIGTNLLAEGFGQHIPRGYTYFAMAFSVGVEMLNLKLRANAAKVVHLRAGMPGTRRARTAGAASHLGIALAALLAGAAGATLYRAAPPAVPSGAPTAPPVQTATTTHGEWIYVPKGERDSIRAYVAYPERKDRTPAVIVIHEIYGLTDWEPTVVDRLAGNGFVAIVPDLLSTKFGRTPADPDSARALIAALEPARVTADLDAVYAYVNGLPAVARGEIGTIGFCWGGGESFRYATNNPKLAAAVVCYGPAPDSAALARIRAPVLGVYGENDARINGSLPQTARAMRALGRPFAYDIYPGTGHGFLKPGRQGNDGKQPDRAWARIVAFYRSAFEQ